MYEYLVLAFAREETMYAVLNDEEWVDWEKCIMDTEPGSGYSVVLRRAKVDDAVRGV